MVVDPSDYPRVLDGAARGRRCPPTLRRELATKVFRHTAAYDGAIAAYLAGGGELLPRRRSPCALERRQALRYGENPHQRAAFYVTGEPGGLAALQQLGGKELSFNNLLDVDATLLALEPVAARRTACVIIKHTTPCGLALGANAGRGVHAGAGDRPGLGVRLGGRLHTARWTPRRPPRCRTCSSRR